MKSIRYFIIIACAGLFFSCASIPPKELVNARQAYQQASSGQAAQLVPAELHKAQVALASAEKSFKNDPKSFRTRDLAYVADRKAKMAEALATTAVENAATARANKEYMATQAEIMKKTKEDLAAEQKARLDAEQQARLDAENRATEAKTEAQRVKESTDAEARRLKELSDAKAAAAEVQRVKEATAAETIRAKELSDAKAAAAEAQRVKELADAEARRVKELADANKNAAAEAQRVKESADAEARRLAEQKDRDNNTIIILEKGKKVVLKGVNFEFNKATLTNESEMTLTMAYNALIANPDVQIEISGHTDNVGSQQYNQALSLKRAQAVKNWLVKKGIASNRMKTVGKGKNEPMASNETDAGRAENRRIEFYVQQ